MKSFELLVADFENYIKNLKTECDLKDNQYINIPDKIEYVKTIQEKIFSEFSTFWNSIWCIVQDIEYKSEEYLEKRKKISDSLENYFKIGLPNTRVYEKPAGYNGDYLTIYYYFTDYLGDSIFCILVNQYSRSIPSAIAHKNRFPYLKQKFDEYSDKNNTNIISLGCGPAIEILEYSQESKENFSKINITLLDMDQRALDFIKIRLGTQDNLKYMLYPIKNLLIDSIEGNIKIEKYDFIYCFGLFDYLKDELILKLIPALVDCLNEGGKLIMTNVHKNISERGYFEFFADWLLILRNEDDMIRLTSKVKDAKKIYIDDSLPNPDNIYLVVEK